MVFIYNNPNVYIMHITEMYFFGEITILFPQVFIKSVVCRKQNSY